MRARSTARVTAVGIAAALLFSACSTSTPAASSAASAAASAASAAASSAPSEAPASAAAPSTAAVAGKKIAWVLWGNDGYQQGQSQALKQAAEADGVTVTLIDGKNDPLVQAKAIDDLIAAGIDGIVWQAADPAAAVEPAKKIRAAGIPLVYVGVAPDKSAGVDAPLVPFNNSYSLTKVAGADAAKFVKDTMHQTPKVVLFDLLNLPLCHDERMTGFMDGIKSVSPDAQTVFWDTVPTTKDGTTSKMENQLQANPDFNIFTGCGGDLILGGVAALQAAGRAKSVNGVPQTEWILTIDGTPAELQLLLDPNTSIMETMTLTPYENGIAAWTALKQIITGELKPDSAETIDTGAGLIYYKSQKCPELAPIFEKEYGLTEIYTPLDCSKYPS
jgi:ABC-type sugar transport system substrate-binding protein